MAEKQDPEQQLRSLVERLRDALSDRLVSVILYGSAAVEDWQEDQSDLNILCVVDSLSIRELSACEGVFRWWKGSGYPPPLLLTSEELETSTDCFPMEFYDIRKHRWVLWGSDVIEGLQIDWSFYRAQVEHELRAKQLRLRQKAAEVLFDPERLGNLLAHSLSTFCVLGRHALILSGHEPRYKKAEVITALEGVLGRRLEACKQVLVLRSSKQVGTPDVTIMFDKYMGEIATLVQFVDALEK